MGFFGGFIVPGTGHYHDWCPPSASVDLEGGAVSRTQISSLHPPLWRVQRASWRWRRWPRPAPVPCPRASRCVADTHARWPRRNSRAPSPRARGRAAPAAGVFGRGVGVIHDHGGARREGGMEELLLPPVLVAVVREEVLANVLVGAREPLAK